SITLPEYVLQVISPPGARVRSSTLTQNRLSLCIARDVPTITRACTVRVDRTLRNLTVGNDVQTRQYDLSKCVRIGNTTVRIIASFTRDDDRIRTAIASRYGQRRTARVGHLLHNATKTVVALAVRRKTAIVLENI